jgi:type IV secretion system protein TrbB
MTDRAKLLALGGPVLAGYLDDPLVTDITANDNGTCFIYHQREGKQAVAHPGFGRVQRFLLAAADAAGKELHGKKPRLQCALMDVHWRIQAAIPPATANPWMAVRKHPETVFPLEDLVAKGAFTLEQHAVLLAALAAQQRIFFMGAVGSAKTTVMNSCLDALRDHPAIAVYIAEDDPEVISSIPDTRRIWAVEELFTLKDMVEDSLRAMPTLLVVGEVRNGATTLAMLRAFQTGHGGMTTVHGKSVEVGLARIEQLVQEVSADPQRALIGEVIDLIVHMEHDQLAHTRRCTGILAVDGWDGTQYVQRRVA